MARSHSLRALGAALLGAAALAHTAAAQSTGGVGSTGAQVLQLPAGGRAAALSGAYTAVAGDPDGVFYNPASSSRLDLGASVAYQRYVENVALGSFSGMRRFGPVVLGANVVYLDGGSVDVIEPDPDYGGERGRATGRSASASEQAARVTAAFQVGQRLSLGVAAGYVSTNMADVTRSAPFADIGAQMRFGAFSVGAAARNLGGALSGSGVESADMPREARAGAAFDLNGRAGFGGTISADYVRDLSAKTSRVAGGVELGLRPAAARAYGLVGRFGYAAASDGNDLGTFVVGGGLMLRAVSVDYAYQNLDVFGPVHRVGLRFAR